MKKNLYIATDAALLAIFLAASILWGFGFEEPTRWLAVSGCAFAALYWLKMLGRDLDG